jgi:Major Facilitator Superfamily
MLSTFRQRRILAAAALIDSLGDGLFLAGSALFFTRGLGLPVTQVGLGLSIAGVIGLTLGAEIGRLADRLGPRDVFVVMMLVQTVAVASYVFVTGLLGLVLTSAVAAVCRQGAQASRGALIAQLAGEEAPALRAYLHAVINVGIAGGAALAGFAVAKDTHAAYLALMLADAATFAVAGLTALLLPRVAIIERPPGAGKGRALTDRRFMVLTLLNGVISLQFIVSGFLLPLWVVFHTEAPRWLASPLLLLNTAVVVLLQVRVSGRHKGLGRAAAAYRLAGLLLLASSLFFATATYGRSAFVAAAVLTTAMIVHSAAELLTVAGAIGLSYGLAPAHAVGEYQGVWNLGFGASLAVGPGLLTVVCLQGGPVGWAVLGTVMALIGWLIRILTLRAARVLDATRANSPVEV